MPRGVLKALVTIITKERQCRKRKEYINKCLVCMLFYKKRERTNEFKVAFKKINRR